MAYAPDPDSNVGRLREFFYTNPHEELTRGEMQVKFNLTKAQTDTVVAFLKKTGIIESFHIYRLKK